MWRRRLRPDRGVGWDRRGYGLIAMTIAIRLADRDAISLGQGIAVFATFITGRLAISAGVWLSWFLAR